MTSDSRSASRTADAANVGQSHKLIKLKTGLRTQQTCDSDALLKHLATNVQKIHGGRTNTHALAHTHTHTHNYKSVHTKNTRTPRTHAQRAHIHSCTHNPDTHLFEGPLGDGEQEEEDETEAEALDDAVQHDRDHPGNETHFRWRNNQN